MTFDYNAAEKAVQETLEKVGNQLNVKCLISDVTEQDFGWVFLYETQNANLRANAVLVFDKIDGLVYLPGAATTIDAAIEHYRLGCRTRA